MTRKFLQLLILFTLLIIVSLVLVNISLKNKTNTITPPTITPSVSITEKEDLQDIPLLTVVAENLEVPWALAFLPDKSILFTERPGRVRLIDNNGNLNLSPTAQIEDVKQIGEGGLLGIVIHPNFKVNHFVYLYYTYAGNSDQTLNRVARFSFDENRLIGPTIIVDAIPGAPNHNGGRIKFGPDNFLYITTGDAQNPSLAQDINSLAGKILRVTDDGKPAKDNPFGNEVFSFGHRNPQGITWDEEGRLWETEHGQSAKDESNLIEIGKNYGWPIIQGGEQKLGMETPILNSGSDTWAPAGATYYSYPDLRSSVFFGGLRGQALYQARLQLPEGKASGGQAIIKNGSLELKTHFKGEFGRIREVIVGPDNMLYITTSNRDGRGNPSPDDDKIIRVNPKKL